MTFAELWRHARTDKKKMARLLVILAAMALAPGAWVAAVVLIVAPHV